MLDLRDDAITAWAAAATREVGRIPDRVPDGGEPESVSKALARLSAELDARAMADAAELAASLQAGDTADELRAILARGGARLTLRLLAWLAEALPGGVEVAADLIAQRSDNPLGGLLAESERSALLQRLFASDRLRSLEEACRDVVGLREAA